MSPWLILLDRYPFTLPVLLLIGAALAVLVLSSDSANRRAVNLLRAWKGQRKK